MVVLQSDEKVGLSIDNDLLRGKKSRLSLSLEALVEAKQIFHP